MIGRAVRLCVLVTAAILSLSVTTGIAHAAAVTWEFQGKTIVREGKDSLPLNVGDPVRVLVRFETDIPFTSRQSSDNRPGFRYEYANVGSLQFEIFGGGCNPCRPVSIPEFNWIYVRDNFADPARNELPDVAKDGLTFLMNPHASNKQLHFSLILRDNASAFVPQIINATARAPLPVSPDPRLVQMNISEFLVRKDNSVVSSFDLNLVNTWRTPSPPDFDVDKGVLRIPLLRVGDVTYRDIRMILVDAASLRFRVVEGTLETLPSPTVSWLDMERSILYLPRVTVGKESFANVALQQNKLESMEFSVNAGTLLAADHKDIKIPISGLVSWAGGTPVGGIVNVRCANGDFGALDVKLNGWFDDVLLASSPYPFPCLLQTNADGQMLYGFMEGPVDAEDKRLSISLLSTLTLTKALGDNPAGTFQALGSVVTQSDLDQQQLRNLFADARQFVVSALESFSGHHTINYSDQRTPDVFRVTSVQDRVDRDHLFEAVDVALAAANYTYEGLESLVIQHASLREHFADKIYKTITEAIIPNVTGINCSLTPPGPSRRLKCVVTGTNLTFPRALGGRFSVLGITAARASLAQPKSDPTKPYQPNFCGRGAMEIGTLVYSTDSSGWGGEDPLQMFAEEIHFPECGPQISFEDSLLVEVVKDNGNRAGPAGWDLLRGASVSTSVQVPALTANSVQISGSCTEIKNSWQFGTHAPVISAGGQASITAGFALDVLVSKNPLTDAQLLAAMLDIFNTNDGALKLQSTCSNGSTVCSLPMTNGSFNAVPGGQAGYEFLQLYSNWPELGIVQGGGPRTLYLHGVVHNFFSVAARQTITVNCPAPR